MSFSPIIRVRKLLDKMKSERDSPRLKRLLSRTTSEDLAERPRIMSPRVHHKQKLQKVFLDNHFEKLPVEIKLVIFLLLNAKDTVNIRLVCKEWKKLADSNMLWKRLCIYDWNNDFLIEETWKETYFRLDKEFCCDTLWEGMSKWIEPSGFDNEQKTSCRLQFCKRNDAPKKIWKPSSPSGKRKNNIVASGSESQPNPYKDSLYKIHGSGITINSETPSPFQIEGERLENDSSSFRWHKNFERHTSVYNGKVDLVSGIVSGTIDYNDGTTNWKGIFVLNRTAQNLHKSKENVLA